MNALPAVGRPWIVGASFILAVAACNPAGPTTPSSPSPMATPATIRPSPSTPGPTPSPEVTPAASTALKPSPTAELESLPYGTLASVPQESLLDAIGLWPPEPYGGLDEPPDEGYELVIETPDELIVVDGLSGRPLHTLERPAVAQINAVLVTADSVWLTDHDAGTVLRLDRESGEVLARIELSSDYGARAVSLVETEDGIWAGSAHVHPESIVLIDPATNSVDRSIAAGAYPGYGDGSFWFGRDESRSAASGIRRVDPSTGEVLATIDPGTADSCYVGGSFPDVVWSFCFARQAGRVDVEAGRVSSVLPLGGPGSFIGVADGHSWFLVEPSGDLPRRILAVDNGTNVVARAFALTATPLPFDSAAIIGESLWIIDVEAGELRMVALEDL